MSEAYQNLINNIPQDVSLSMGCCVDADDLRKLFGVGPTHNSDGYDVTYGYYEQKRKHKKKRINKKWLKRYGVIQKFVTLKGCEVSRNNDEINFTSHCVQI